MRSAVLTWATLTLCSRAHGRAAAQRWLALWSCYSRYRWLQICLQSGCQYADGNTSSQSDPACSLVLEQDRAPGQTQMQKKKKRKLGPTDCRSGSVHVTTIPPRHADKDCLTTEENVTISSSRITRQGRCRSGAAESSLVARNHQPTKRRRPQRTMGTRDGRIVA